MTFPIKLPRWTIIVFLALLAIGIAEAMVAVPSWYIVYPFIKDRLNFLSSFFAATEQFASSTAIICAIVIVWIHRPDLRRTIVPFLISLLLATIVNTGIKFAAGRARPKYGVLMGDSQKREISDYLKDHDNPVLKPESGDYWMWFSKDRPGLEPFRFFSGEFDGEKLHPFGEYDSFPSGHATSVMVLATFLAILFPRSRIVWYILGIGCAFARVRFRRHHPADVIVGGAMGWFAVYLIFSWNWPFRLGERIVAWIDGRKRVSRLEEGP